MSKFEVGDRVKIKQWSDMKNEFGLDESGAIDCRCFFTKAMKSHCGRIGKIVSVLSDDRYMLSFDGKRSIWLFSDDMIEKGESRMKFKVGDKVIGISGAVEGYKGVVVEGEHVNSGLVLCRFKNFKGHNGNGCTERGKDYDTSNHYYVYPNEIELINNETIVIYRKDDKVIALDKRTGKKTEAKCHPDDEFNFETGAKLAFERLLKEPEKEERYYNGKIIFTKGDHVFFKTGHIYEIIDGKFANTKFPIGYAFKSLQDIKDYFTKDDEHDEPQPKWSICKTLEFIEVLDD